MKISGAILLSLAAALVAIGAHLTMKSGIVASYPLFMFATVLLFWHMYRKKNNERTEDPPPNRKKNKKK
jgi:uncharacterized membrane protein